MVGRLPCCVPGCQRTMGHEVARKRFGHLPAEWICQAHWARLTRNERRVWHRHQRRARKLGFNPAPEAACRVWEALKRRSA